MTANSFAPLLACLNEVLTTSTGKPQAITPTHLFRTVRGIDKEIAGAIREHKRAFVDVGNLRVIQPSHFPGSVARYEVRVRITRAYWCGEARFPAEWEKALIEALDDSVRIRSAMCWPGAHRLNAASQETGLDGGALSAVDQTAEGPTRIEPSSIFTFTDTYRATVEIVAQIG